MSPPNVHKFMKDIHKPRMRNIDQLNDYTRNFSRTNNEVKIQNY